MRIDGCHEDGVRHRIDRRHLAERTRAQCGPQAGLLQVLAHLFAAQAFQLVGRVAREGDFIIALGSMTTDCSTRFSPRCTALTTPAPGAV